MPELPSFNYQTIYFFLLSLYAAIFVLSLLGFLRVNKPSVIMFASFFNVFISLIAWILDIYVHHLLAKPYAPLPRHYREFRTNRLGIFIGAIIITSLITFISLGGQL